MSGETEKPEKEYWTEREFLREDPDPKTFVYRDGDWGILATVRRAHHLDLVHICLRHVTRSGWLSSAWIGQDKCPHCGKPIDKDAMTLYKLMTL